MTLVSMVVTHQPTDVFKVSQCSLYALTTALSTTSKPGAGSSQVNQLPGWEQNPGYDPITKSYPFSFCLFLVSPCIFFFPSE